MKSVWDFDSDYDWYDYLDSLKNHSDDDREPDENDPEEDYREEQDRNYPSNDVRWDR